MLDMQGASMRQGNVKEQMASKMSPQTNKTINQFFGPQRVTVGNNPSESKSGTCSYCKLMKGRHNRGNGQLPPYHPNCKCTVE